METPLLITLREVSPRDGLQGEPVAISTAAKVALVDRLSSAGFPRINVTSFVSPKAMPQMADAADVMAAITRRPGVVYDATVPNVIGAQRAIDAGADSIVVFVIASDAPGYGPTLKSIDESMAEAEKVVALARSAGLQAVGTVATAFGSPTGEAVSADTVSALAARFAAAGATGVALGDTTGEANPRQVRDLVARLLDELGEVELALHFHDTRGLALANVLAAMDAGATHFDSAVGGIGGSPGTRNSSGNAATEDLLYMCESMGITTGVDLGEVLDVYDTLEQMLGHALPGRLGRLERRAAASLR